MIKRITNRCKRFMRDRALNAAHIDHRKKNDYSTIDSIVGRYRSAGGLSHQYQFYKLWSLEKILNDYKPKNILELGSGTSSAVFSKYADQNGATVLSVDESEHWAENTHKLCNSNNIKIITRPRVFKLEGTPPFINYEGNFNGTFDFVFIDGPSLEVAGIKIRHAVNANIFDLDDLPRIIVVDGRQATANHIAKVYSDKYRATFSDLHVSRKIEKNYTYFSIFEKI